MSEFLVADYTNYDQPGDEVPLRIMGLKGLLAELRKAADDRLYCIAVYEIKEQCFLDFSVPRPLPDDEEDNGV